MVAQVVTKPTVRRMDWRLRYPGLICLFASQRSFDESAQTSVWFFRKTEEIDVENLLDAMGIGEFYTHAGGEYGRQPRVRESKNFLLIRWSHGLDI
jgi:hypothetical protein